MSAHRAPLALPPAPAWVLLAVACKQVWRCGKLAKRRDCPKKLRRRYFVAKGRFTTYLEASGFVRSIELQTNGPHLVELVTVDLGEPNAVYRWHRAARRLRIVEARERGETPPTWRPRPQQRTKPRAVDAPAMPPALRAQLLAGVELLELVVGK
jgi:hypothetical protein